MQHNSLQASSQRNRTLAIIQDQGQRSKDSMALLVKRKTNTDHAYFYQVPLLWYPIEMQGGSIYNVNEMEIQLRYRLYLITLFLPTISQAATTFNFYKRTFLPHHPLLNNPRESHSLYVLVLCGKYNQPSQFLPS